MAVTSWDSVPIPVCSQMQAPHWSQRQLLDSQWEKYKNCTNLYFVQNYKKPTLLLKAYLKYFKKFIKTDKNDFQEQFFLLLFIMMHNPITNVVNLKTAMFPLFAAILEPL